jgi:hypothetical protein
MLAELRKFEAEYDAVAADLFAVEKLTAGSRNTLKRFVTHLLIRPVPNAIQAEVVCSMLDALEDDHLVELHQMVHFYDPGRSVN